MGPAEVMRDVALAATYNTTVASGFGQLGAAAALLASKDGGQGDGVATAVADWQARRDLILRELEGLPVVKPDGGWSLLVNASALGLKAPELAQRLFQHARIAATPMTQWGQQVAPDYVRLVFATERLERLSGIGDRFGAALR
ncbi:aspartate/methionine/tyrosine aminotransferase [Pseudarthrobacter sp. SLBN-100]|uniref:aminotransferase class I/II-fold pyridoxal phosphate-dependent enzyme n=1 Tax=Arthrobacter sp. SLBN-100 TaxID=2768450 RepID=UPI00190F9B0E|nr:aminotransferase class I/II-fold pyridoxal phosphate-dependent enzyme [Arthrobacter sp. SLBN-100]